MKLGIPIQGVSLSNDDSLQVYDFREVNRQRLSALRGISIIIDDMNNLTGIKGVGLGIDLEVSAYAKGLNSLIKLHNISGVLRLDNFLFIQPFKLTTTSDLKFDLTLLSDDKAFSIYSSLIKMIDEGIFHNKKGYIPNVIIDDTKHDLFLFATLLLRFNYFISNDKECIPNCDWYKDKLIPLFNYWYSHSYTYLRPRLTASKDMVLALLNSELYSDDFLILLRSILLEGDVGYVFVTLCINYHALYGTTPEEFKFALRNTVSRLKKVYHIQ